MAELFIAFHRRWPRLANQWLGEDADMYWHQREDAERVEDAVIMRNNRPLLAIEVGAYRADRFAALFQDLAARQLSFRCY